jgi:hypothetical protein
MFIDVILFYADQPNFGWKHSESGDTYSKVWEGKMYLEEHSAQEEKSILAYIFGTFNRARLPRSIPRSISVGDLVLYRKGEYEATLSYQGEGWTLLEEGSRRG